MPRRLGVGLGMSGPHASTLPADVVAIFGNLNSSNEAKLALLERRFAVPASPATSRGDGAGLALLNQHSMTSCHSIRESTPPGPASSFVQPSQSWQVAGGNDQGVDRKRRRGSDAGTATTGPVTAGGYDAKEHGGDSPPYALAPRPSLSPFIAPAGETGPRLEATPTSSKKPRNTINRYFPCATSTGDGASGGMTGHSVEEALRSSAAALQAAEQQSAQYRCAEQRESV